MRYFTPELFARMNSGDQKIADAADAEWGSAVEAYEGRLAEIESKMPEGVRALSKAYLHDAEFLGLTEFEDHYLLSPAPRDLGTMGVLSLRKQGRIVVLLYALREPIRKSDAITEYPFSNAYVHWLYDEIDAAGETAYIQRVLLSDGRVVQIPFTSVVVHTIPLPVESKQPA